MPTGYTSSVGKGELKDFPTFALQCVRQFDIFVETRDAPSDAPIPDEFEVKPFSMEQVEKAKARLKEVSSWTNTEALRYAYAARRQKREDIVSMNQGKDVKKRRYLDMLGKVILWDPSSGVPEDLKKFMTDQLIASIQSDCQETPDNTSCGSLSGKTYKAEMLENAKRSLRFWTKEHREEVEHVNYQNQLVRQLRASLGEVR